MATESQFICKIVSWHGGFKAISRGVDLNVWFFVIFFSKFMGVSIIFLKFSFCLIDNQVCDKHYLIS